MRVNVSTDSSLRAGGVGCLRQQTVGSGGSSAARFSGAVNFQLFSQSHRSPGIRHLSTKLSALAPARLHGRHVDTHACPPTPQQPTPSSPLTHTSQQQPISAQTHTHTHTALAHTSRARGKSSGAAFALAHCCTQPRATAAATTTTVLPGLESQLAQHMSRSSSSNPLRGLGEQLLTLVWESASKEQLGQWLRVPLEHAAAKHNGGSSALCSKLLLAGADAFVRRHSVLDRSPLLAAAQAGNDSVVSALLENGSAPDGEDWETSIFLSDAILAAGGLANSSTSLVTDADSSSSSSSSSSSLSRDGFTTPLHLAASGGHLSMVRTLVTAGADTDVEDENGDTPLHLAVFRGFEQVVEELVAAGASVDTIDAEGETPLHTASAHGSLGVVRAILRGSRGNTLLLCHKDHLEMSPLHRAALGGHCDVMEELLSRGSSLHSLAGNARTPLHAAAMSSSGDAVRFLLGRDPSTLEAEDRDGRTALHLASGHRLGSDSTLLALLEAGAGIEAKTCLGETPLHGACKSLRVSAVEQLLRFGADDGAVDRDGRTPSALTSALLQSQCPGMFRDMLKIILQLLAAAPADKVWRRRGWLLMLRSREQGEIGPGAAAVEQEFDIEDGACVGVFAGGGTVPRRHSVDPEDGNQHRSSSGGGESRRPRKVGKVESTAKTAAVAAAAAAAADGAVVARERSNNPCYLESNGGGGAFRLGGVRGDEGDPQLRSVVKRVVGVCEDGVFRNVVAFL